MAGQRLVLLVHIFLTFIGCLSLHHHGCVTLDAAIRYNGITYLFTGQDSIALNEDRGEASIKNKFESWGGLPRIDAALVWQGDGYPYFFEGTDYFYYSAWRMSTKGPYDYSDWDDALNLHEGLDAAGTIGDSSYFFKCCNFINNTKESYQSPASLEDLGIDCDVHAAFALSEDELAIIKYDKLWVMCNNGTVSGPSDANAVLHLKSIRLCKENEDAGTSIADEIKEEKAEHEKDGDHNVEDEDHDE